MKLVTVKEISKILNIKEPTVYSWAYNGTIPSYKLNGLLRFDLEEIEQWIKQSKMTPDKTLGKNIIKTKSTNYKIDTIIKKSIDDVKGKKYTKPSRKPDCKQGLRKED